MDARAATSDTDHAPSRARAMALLHEGPPSVGWAARVTLFWGKVRSLPAGGVVAAVCVLALSGGGAFAIASLGRTSPASSAPDRPPGSLEPSTQGRTAAPRAGTSTSLSPDIYVYTTGAVVRAGLYRLPTGSRVSDAIRAAGGFAFDADPDRVNLAAPLDDGLRLFVPHRNTVGEPPLVVGPDRRPIGGAGGGGGAGGAGGGPTSTLPPAPVNINTATEPELEQLPGVGPATASAIVAYRLQHGPFSSVEQLQAVRGIGPAKLSQIRDRVMV